MIATVCATITAHEVDACDAGVCTCGWSPANLPELVSEDTLNDPNILDRIDAAFTEHVACAIIDALAKVAA